jgi:hypothetical protein
LSNYKKICGDLKILMNGYFLMRWVLATTLGLTAGGLLSMGIIAKLLASYAERAPDLFSMVCVLCVSALGAALLGVAQWVVLRGHIFKSSQWIWGTIAGGMVFGITVYITDHMIRRRHSKDFVSELLVVVLSTGITLGIAQGWMLGKSKIGSWFVANLAGLLVFAFIGFIGGPIGAAILGPVTYSLITGGALMEALEK